MGIFGRLYFGLRGIMRPQIFTSARDWPRLASAHPNGDGVPPKKFNCINLKFGLKLSYNFGASGNILMKLFQPTCREAGVITCVQVSEGPPPKIWEGQKTSKFRRDFWQLSTSIANILGTGRHFKNRKRSSSTTTPPTLPKETWWILVHIRKSYRGAYWPTQVDIFRDTIFRPLKGAVPSKFYTR